MKQTPTFVTIARLTMSMLTRCVPSRLAPYVLRRIHTTRPVFEETTAMRRSPARSGLYATAFVLSTGLLVAYYFDARSALHRYFLTPLLRHALDAETGHKVAVKVLKSGLGPRDPLPDDQRLEFKVFLYGPYVARFAPNSSPVMGTGHLQSCWTGCWIR